YNAVKLCVDLSSLSAFMPYSEVDYAGAHSSSGLAVLSRFPLQRLIPIPLPEPDGLRQHAAHTVVAARDGPLDLLVLHLTPRSEAAQLAAIAQLHAFLNTLPPERPRVVAGAFNCAPESAA